MEFSSSRIHLSPELLSEVLSRLPVKSLLRFKCVSKFWVELISTPYFISLHLHNYSKQRARLNITQLLIQSGYDIDNCFQTPHLDSNNENKAEARNLTHPLPLEYFRPFLMSGGTCNGLLKSSGSGFGYDRNYRFVGMYRVKGPFCYTFKVYSLKSGSWCYEDVDVTVVGAASAEREDRKYEGPTRGPD